MSFRTPADFLKKFPGTFARGSRCLQFVRFPARVELPNRMLIRALDLVHRQDFDLRFPSVKFDCSGDADGFPLERGDPLVSRHF
jgi:hypothetical protein